MADAPGSGSIVTTGNFLVLGTQPPPWFHSSAKKEGKHDIWGMVVALASEPGPGWLLPAFAGLMLLGDLVKLVFLRVHDFTVRGTSKAVLYGLTLVYVVGYLLILLLELAR